MHQRNHTTREINHMETERHIFSRLKWSAVVGTLVLGVGLQAHAGCLDVSSLMKKASLEPQDLSGVRFIRAAYSQDGDWTPGFFQAPIVGLWAFKYVSEGNTGIKDGTQIDGGNTLWFADGNELTYSAIRNPTTGATCLGVWERTGRSTYELNHVGNSWDPTVTAPFGGSSGPAFIRQHVTLASDAMSYTGTFEISQLENDGKTLAPGFPIKGKIEAVRVTIRTTTQPLPLSGNEY
jgi:hypothetical protein